MSRLATLKLLDGDLEQGVKAILTIATLHPLKEAAAQELSTDYPVKAELPPNASLANTVRQWQEKYRRLDTTRIQVNSISYDTSIHYFCPSREQLEKALKELKEDLKELEQDLRSQFNDWLLSDSFRPIRDKWLEQLLQDEVKVLIQTTDQSLLRFPWHLWDLIEQNHQAEVALSIPDAVLTAKTSALPRRLRILAILGDSTGIDIKHDRQLLESLPDAETTFLVEPPRRDINDQLWEGSWDILFFAGHSRTEGERGRIYINKTDSLTIEDLRYALEKAIGRGGLKLAIFNSCDGLGLALELQQLNIPQVIVMREPVPDRVAQAFLTYFLPPFLKSRSVYLAEREARLRLQGLENEFPCATWLPVIFQNPLALSPQPLPASPWPRVRSALLISVAVAAAMLGIRNVGLLQPLELQTFDQLQRLRPQEQPDPRLLVVTATEADIQKRKEWPLTDRTLGQLLSKLEQHEPEVIGLDIYRDFPIPTRDRSGQQDLRPHLLSPRLVSVCAVPKSDQTEGIAPPPGVPSDRLGFSDVVVDDDGVLRRQLLFMQPDVQSPCPTTEAFSLQLALHYLAAQGIEPELTPQEEYKIKNTIFKPLSAQRGSYRTTDTRGYQILLNYRVPESPGQVARQVTLSEVLNNQVDPEWVKGKVVLIGVTAESVKDNFWTPYSRSARPHQPLSGVLVQAQMVSQILGAVLDGRSLLWVWPDWVEGLWIVGWSVVGGVLAILVRSRVGLVSAIGAAVVVLSAICWGSLLSGGWLPLVPPALALVITGGIVWVFLQSPAQIRRVLGNL
jgi:CHASE2 domain-containing sensor protein